MDAVGVMVMLRPGPEVRLGVGVWLLAGSAGASGLDYSTGSIRD